MSDASVPPKRFHLSFTIGPVQAFVAQARRTRDFWMGSWLLSHLAESALAAAERCEGYVEPVIPFRSESERKEVTSLHTETGGIPNRFEIAFSSIESAEAAGKAATDAFHQRWNVVAQEVFDQFEAFATEQGPHTADIWKRQIDAFWEISWVADPCDAGNTISDLANARKNLRDVPATLEPGVKCSLMATWQEISGHTNRNNQKAFWQGIRAKLPSDTLDLGENERLCAIAMIKRFAPRILRDLGCSFDLQSVNWPSTAFLAAQSWLQNSHQNDSVRELATNYADFASDNGVDRTEFASSKHAKIPWATIDGPAWFSSAIQHSQDWELTTEQRKELNDRLSKLYSAADKAGLQKQPLPYYALLLMDGDSMGKLLQSGMSPGQLSESLNTFTKRVDDVVVTVGQGRTVYAGGDDVLAILPARDALAVAMRLHEEYRRAFDKYRVTLKQHQVEATISASIVFAHWKQPFRQVIQTAHHLLDDVAKDATGRDSVAIGIIQGSGLNAVWSAPWGEAIDNLHALIPCFDSCDSDSSATDDETDLISTVSERAPSGANEKPLPSYNASYLYHLREQFSHLFTHDIDSPGAYSRLSTEMHGESGLLLALANAEYRRRMSRDQRTKYLSAATEARLQKLMRLSQRHHRDHEPDAATFGFDGWRVARFLKQVDEGKVGSDD